MSVKKIYDGEENILIRESFEENNNNKKNY